MDTHASTCACTHTHTHTSPAWWSQLPSLKGKEIRLRCASGTISRLRCASGIISRLRCASGTISRLRCASGTISRLRCVSGTISSVTTCYGSVPVYDKRGSRTDGRTLSEARVYGHNRPWLGHSILASDLTAMLCWLLAIHHSQETVLTST